MWPPAFPCAAVAHIGATISLGDMGDIDQIVVERIDEALTGRDLVVIFDPEGVGLAVAELDRLHDELTHGRPTVSTP